jgi:gluconolactonase
VARVNWSYRIAPDGGLIHGERFYHLELPGDELRGPIRSGAEGLAFDDQGYLYAATKMGVQICDQPGRVAVYRRHLRRKGVFPWQLVKLPHSQL